MKTTKREKIIKKVCQQSQHEILLALMDLLTWYRLSEQTYWNLEINWTYFSTFVCQFWCCTMFLYIKCAKKTLILVIHIFYLKSKQQTYWALQSFISMVPKNDHCWKTSHITFHNPHAPNRLDRMHIMDSFCLRWFSDLPLKSILIIYIPLNFQDACQKIPPMDHIAHVPIPKMCVLVLSHFIEIWQNHKGKRKVTLSF